MAFYSRLAAAALVLLTAGQAAASVVWRGDFESGDLAQWTKSAAVSPDRLEVVEGGSGKGGRYALKATVLQGDNPIAGASGNRTELTYTSYEASGTERYYRWQTKFAEDFPSADAWQLYTQWHHEGPSGSPPVEFVVRKEDLYLNVVGERVWEMPLERGRWIDFVFHVKWSPDPSEGFVELYVDGEKVLDKLPRATQFPGELNYLKQGLYRDTTVQPVGVVYHDGMTIGTDLADVMPEAEARAAATSETEGSQASPAAPGLRSPPSSGFAPGSPGAPDAAVGCGASSSGSGSPMLVAGAASALALAARSRRRPALSAAG